MKTPSSLTLLIEALLHLPGIGPKSAQGMAYHLLQHDAFCAIPLPRKVCKTCLSPEREPNLLCVVETPIDQLTIEQTLTLKGLYFVLMGRLINIYIC